MQPEAFSDILDEFLNLGGESPQFEKRTWTIPGNKKFSVRLVSGYTCREEINDCLNCNVPPETGVGTYSFFEIKNDSKKGWSSVVRARIRYPNIGLYLNPPDPELVHPENNPKYETIEDPRNGTKTFIKKLTGEPGIDGWITTSSTIIIRTLPTITPSPPKPGELTVLQNWCYDPLPNITSEDNIPGATMSLTCQPITSDGKQSATPWRIKIRNYTLVRSGTSFKQIDATEEFVLLSTDQLREIDEFLSSEWDKYITFNILHTIAEVLPDDFSTEDDIEKSINPLDIE